MRATASAFCYHQGAIFGGLVPPVLVYFATTYNLGFAIPMLVSTIIAAASVVISLLLSPETKGKARPGRRLTDGSSRGRDLRLKL